MMVPGRTQTLRGLDLPRTEPAGKKIEEVHAVLDEDAAAFAAIPEPVFGRQPLVARVVFEVGVEQISERFAFQELPDCIE